MTYLNLIAQADNAHQRINSARTDRLASLVRSWAIESDLRSPVPADRKRRVRDLIEAEERTAAAHPDNVWF